MPVLGLLVATPGLLVLAPGLLEPVPDLLVLVPSLLVVARVLPARYNDVHLSGEMTNHQDRKSTSMLNQLSCLVSEYFLYFLFLTRITLSDYLITK